jgi:hypothetical protein
MDADEFTEQYQIALELFREACKKDFKRLGAHRRLGWAEWCTYFNEWIAKEIR